MKTSKISFRKYAGLGAALFFSSAVFTSCLKDDDTPDAPVAGLMAVNLVPDKGAVNIALSGSLLTNFPLSYNSFTGAYLGVYPGARDVEAYENGGIAFATTPVNFEAEKYYSVFTLGANGNYRNVVVEDQLDSLSASSGQAYIRFINAIPDSAQPIVKISAAGTDVVNSTAGFATVSEFKTITPGSVVIDINNGGNIDLDRTITVEARKIYTVLLAGVPGNATTPVSIKFIANGELEAEPSGRIGSSSKSVKNN